MLSPLLPDGDSDSRPEISPQEISGHRKKRAEPLTPLDVIQVARAASMTNPR
jgi:hypothetical protein